MTEAFFREKEGSGIRVLRTLPDGKTATWSIRSGARYNYRPRMVEWRSEGIYIVWDSYVDRTYDIFGCEVDPAGPGQAVRISADARWENRSTLCRDAGGSLWTVLS